MVHKIAGLRSGVKQLTYDAFMAAFTDEFWSKIDESVSEVDLNKLVFTEFPIEKKYLREGRPFPFIVLNVSFGTVTWDDINPPNRMNSSIKTIRTQCQTTIDIYSDSAANRDRVLDSLINMLLFAYNNKEHSVFASTLRHKDETWLEIYPVLNSISVSDVVGAKGIEWEPNTVFWKGSVSYDSNVHYTMPPITDDIAIIKEVDTHAEPENEQKSQAIGTH